MLPYTRAIPAYDMEEVIKYNPIEEMKDNIIRMERQLYSIRVNVQEAHFSMEHVRKTIKFNLASEYRKYFCAINCISEESLNNHSIYHLMSAIEDNYEKDMMGNFDGE